MGRTSQLVLPPEQVLHAVSQSPGGALDGVSRPRRRDRATRTVRVEAALFLRRNRGHRSTGGRAAPGHTGKGAATIRCATAREDAAGDFDTAPPDPKRGSEHV